MLADTVACDPRNVGPGTITSGASAGSNLYSDDIEARWHEGSATCDCLQLGALDSAVLILP